MAFGIPGSEATSGGAFLGRLQYDARVGFWKIVKRVQQSDGGWDDEPSEPFKNPTFLLDIGSLEVGYINFASPPAFLVVPFGHPIPPRPGEKKTDENGNQRSAFLPGFRAKVYNPKMFGDEDAYYFANNSKTVLEPMDALHTLCLQAAEAKGGQVPVVKVTGTLVNKIETPRGNNTYYAPVFAIAGWRDRPESFGPRTVPLANGNGHAAPVVLQPAAAVASPAPAARVPAPAPQNNDDWGVGVPSNRNAQVGGADDPLNDAIPF